MSARINGSYLNVNDSYLFAEVKRRAAEYQAAHPEKKLISLGIGDVSRPLAKTVVSAMQKAAGELGSPETFRGYGPEQGYLFLREAICGYYARRGTEILPEEVFISDGAKSDCGNILDIFSADSAALIPDPVYPVYLDTNIMAGHKILYMDATEENGFLPMPDEKTVGDIIYLCSPNNPTGAVYSREQLAEWVDFANRRGSVLLFDAAYECFVTGDMPHSIFEIPGARTCAIEICSFSKKAGFTGTRCGYTIIPNELVREGKQLGKLWLRRQSTKFNGTAYIIQRGAEAVFTEEGERECEENLAYYRGNAKIMAETLDKLGVYYTGGMNSPYIWMKCPDGLAAWDFFRVMLEEIGVIGTPGAGFGRNGERFFRLTAFSGREDTCEAMARMLAYYHK